MAEAGQVSDLGTGQKIASPCASNDDRSPRPFFFCQLTAGGVALVGSGTVANAQQLFRPVTSDVIGTAIFVVCTFEAVKDDITSLLGVADGPSINGETATVSVYHYVPGFAEAKPIAATLASDGTVLNYMGQPGGDRITFSYSLATQNPTMNPTVDTITSCKAEKTRS